MEKVLGIDIGGSGIKGTIVNTKLGEFLAERHRIETPQPATPEAISKIVHKIVKHFSWNGKIGCGFPAVVHNGVVKTASNIDKSCIGANVNKIFSERTGCETRVFNDADAAGFAELKFGKGQDLHGLVIFLTVGTGIGSAMFYRGKLIPNTEFGHIYMSNGLIAEKYCSDAVRKKENLNWDVWGVRFNDYLEYLDKLFYPDLIIVGGGTSKKLDKFKDQLKIKTPVESAHLLNQAGIIGAAILS